jgi:hypothetical protein
VYVKKESRTALHEDCSNENVFDHLKEVLKGAGSFLWRGSIGWCVNQMPSSTPMGTIFNSLYSFIQKNL